MSYRSWVFLFLSIVYVGCAGQVPPPVQPSRPEPTLPTPRLVRTPDRLVRTPEPESLRSLELPMQDQVVELGFLRLDDVAHLLILGRRTLSLIRIEPAAAELLHEADLLASIDPQARLRRHAQGCLQFLVPPDRTPAPWLHLFSTGLGFPTAGSAAFRVHDGRLIQQQPMRLESAGGIGPCDVFQEAWQYGWPGRALVLLSSMKDLVFIHLAEDGSLRITAPSGEERILGPQSGELLASTGDLHAARIFVSSLALPGEPDHVQEYYWDGQYLREARRSREFSGRLAALALLPGDGRFVVAETDLSGSVVHILRDEDLWLEAAP